MNCLEIIHLKIIFETLFFKVFGNLFDLLPPAYVVRGKVLFSQVSVCPHLRGSIYLPGRGVPTFPGLDGEVPTFPGGGRGGYLPSQVWTGGYPPSQVGGYLPWWGGTYLGRGGYLPWWGVPTLAGGYLPRVGIPPPRIGTPPPPHLE